MEFLGDFVIITGALAAIGVALDKVILQRHDVALKRALLNFWVYLSAVRPKALPRATAATYLRFVRRYIGPDIRSWRFLLTSVAISAFMTTLFFFVGKAIRNAILRTVDPTFGSFFELFPAYLEMYQLHLDKGFVYPVRSC